MIDVISRHACTAGTAVTQTTVSRSMLQHSPFVRLIVDSCLSKARRFCQMHCMKTNNLPPVGGAANGG